MEKLIANIIENNKEYLSQDTFKQAFFCAIHEYVKAGNNLSELQWFKGLNFETLENKLKLKQVA